MTKAVSWVTMEKLGKLPPCPKLCRGGECNGISCKEEEPGFPYSHINDMVVCHDKSHMSMATRDRCFLFHMWPARKRFTKPPATNLGGGTSGARHVPPSNRSNQHKTGKPRNANGTGNRTQLQQQQQQQQQQQHPQRAASAAAASAAATTRTPRPPESN
jgi:hypothetical protein